MSAQVYRWEIFKIGGGQLRISANILCDFFRSVFFLSFSLKVSFRFSFFLLLQTLGSLAFLLTIYLLLGWLAIFSHLLLTISN